MAADSDLFNRWDASFSLSQSLITDLVNQESGEAEITLDEEFVQAARALLTNDSGDDALTALALQLPDEAYLALSLEGVDPDRLHHVRSFVKKELASRQGDEFLRVYEKKNDSSGYSISPEAIGARSLKNTCLDYLLSAGQVDPDMISLAENQYYQATNMTDQIAVLSTIAHLASDTRETLFSHFENKWREHPLVMDKWFTMQALSSAEDTFDKVTQLLEHSSFSLKNPNKVRALIGAFCQNHLHFHDLSGRGYDFLVDMVMKLDGLNPQIAARMTTPLISWKRYERRRQEMMIDGLKRIQNKRNLSRDVYEIVNRGLAGS